MACLALLRTDLHGGQAGPLNTSNAYDPAALRTAYALAAASRTKGTGETVAVVDAYDDPNAAADLAIYRHRWHLPACDPTTGAGCVTKVDQSGHATPVPPVDPTGGWELEESLDLDMVSAICPNCHILLVEAHSAGTGDLSAAENTAVRLGARFVTNSWGGDDSPGWSSAYGADFDHPGVAITVAAGDLAGTYFPASSQFVTSVGGTTLTRARATKRGWRETVWSIPGIVSGLGTASGCGMNGFTDAQPSWQQAFATTRKACPNRVDNDVAAVADPNTPVWAYDSYRYAGNILGWTGVGGTSVASPIIASVYALAGTPAAGSYPASYLYQSGHAADFNDVTSGGNGTCTPGILCRARAGYDGPSGWGTPHGIGGFTSTRSGHTVTVASPGTRDYTAGATIRLPVQAIDTASGQRLRYSAAGLPAGLSISKSTGVISGRLAATSGSATVTLTATDTTGARGTVSFSLVTVANLRAAYHPVPGPIKVETGFKSRPKCLRPWGAKVVVWSCDVKTVEDWTYQPDTSPTNAGTLTMKGKCLDVAAGYKIQFDPCNGADSEQWSLTDGPVWLYSPATRRCLNDPKDSEVNGTQVNVAPCVGFSYREAFTLPPGRVMSGVTGQCMTDPGDSTVSGTPVEILPCGAGAARLWNTFSNWNSKNLPGGLILVSIGNQPGSPVELVRNGGLNTYGIWFPMPDGEIWSLQSGLCLDAQGGVPGSKLVVQRCSDSLGEIWAVS